MHAATFLRLVACGLVACVCTACTPDGLPAETPPATDPGDQGGSPDTSAPDVSPLDGTAPNPNNYVVPFDTARIVEHTNADGRVSRFPSHQMLVLLNEGVPRSRAEELAAQVGARIVGQIPSDGFYQFELATTSLDELDAAIASIQAAADVTGAGRCIIGRAAQACPAVTDNSDFVDSDRCAFAATEYYQAITQFEFFRPYVNLSRVTVGVIDTGLDVSNGEFERSRIINLDEPGRPPFDADEGGHGTAVAGLIAAENNGSGVNGLASAILRDRLWLAVSRTGTNTDIQPQMAIAGAVMMAERGVQIINCSFGWTDEDPTFSTLRETWRRVIRNRPDTLFVIAAGNEHTRLSGYNYAPAGLELTNAFTIAGTAACEPTRLYANSNYGAMVMVGAPGEDVPLVSRTGTHRLATGTSFAAPQVTALAAVLKSIRPALGPAELKRYIQSYAYPTTFGARLVFSVSIGQLLIDMDIGDPVRSWIDPRRYSHYIGAANVLSRMCPPGMGIDVEGHNSMDTGGEEPESGSMNVRAGGGAAFYMAATDEEVWMSVTGSLSSFALGEYVIAAEAPDTMHIGYREGGFEAGGHGISGTLTFSSCSIEQRNPWNGVDPWMVQVSGSFEGVLELVVMGSTDPEFRSASGYFRVPLLVTGTDPDLFEYLEVACEGGMPHAP